MKHLGDDSDPRAVKAMTDPWGLRVEIRCYQADSGHQSCGKLIGEVWETADGDVLTVMGVVPDGKGGATDQSVFLSDAGPTAIGLCHRHGRRVIDLTEVREKSAEGIGQWTQLHRCGSTAFSGVLSE